jgi:hypothetical protein
MKPKLLVALLALLLIVGWWHFRGASLRGGADPGDAAASLPPEAAQLSGPTAKQTAESNVQQYPLTPEAMALLDAMSPWLDRYSKDVHFQRLLNRLGLDEDQKTILTAIWAFRRQQDAYASREFQESSDRVHYLTVEFAPSNEGKYNFQVPVGDVGALEQVIADARLQPDAMAKALLGDAKFAQYEYFAETEYYRAFGLTAVQETAKRSETPILSQTQSDQFVDLMRRDVGVPPIVLFGYPAIPEVVVEQMASSLSAEQMKVLRQIQGRYNELNQAGQRAVDTWRAQQQLQP